MAPKATTLQFITGDNMTPKEITTRLSSVVGKKGIKALKEGGVMKVWKNSVPSNWWIEDKNGKDVWHLDGFLGPGTLAFDETESNTGMDYTRAYKLKTKFKNKL